MKKQNTLSATVEEIPVDEIAAQTAAIFGKQNGNLPIGELHPVPGRMEQGPHRQTR